MIFTLSYKMSDETIEKLKKMKPSLFSGEQCLDENVTGGELIKRSIEVACDARDEFVKETGTTINPLVIVSFGPCKDATESFVGATDPNTCSTDGEEAARVENYYARKLQHVLKSGQADGVVFETLSGSREACIATAELAKCLSKKRFVSMLSFCCRRELNCDKQPVTLSGESLSEAVF